MDTVTTTILKFFLLILPSALLLGLLKMVGHITLLPYLLCNILLNTRVQILLNVNVTFLRA